MTLSLWAMVIVGAAVPCARSNDNSKSLRQGMRGFEFDGEKGGAHAGKPEHLGRQHVAEEVQLRAG